VTLVRRIFHSIGQFLSALGFLSKELWGFMRVRKRYWMAPIFVILLLFGMLIAFVQNAAVAQFIYTLF
jgi:Family of unknown function (DUF5989)